MAIKSTASARNARISPRKARVIVDLVRGHNVAQALDMLAFTQKAAAPIVKKLIESALANAKQADSGVDVDGLYVATVCVDKGPNSHLRRWRPRAMGRATQIVKGVSHITVQLSDERPVERKSARKAKSKSEAAPVTAG